MIINKDFIEKNGSRFKSVNGKVSTDKGVLVKTLFREDLFYINEDSTEPIGDLKDPISFCGGKAGTFTQVKSVKEQLEELKAELNPNNLVAFTNQSILREFVCKELKSIIEGLENE